MYLHLGRTSKHSSSIEHAPKSNPMPLSPTELTTKASASMSFGDKGMLRNSREDLAPANSLASWSSWLSWTQWHSSSIWYGVRDRQKIINYTRRLYVHQDLCIFALPSTFGPVRVLLLHFFLSSFRTRVCRFWTHD